MQIDLWCPRRWLNFESTTHASWLCPKIRDVSVSSSLGVFWNVFYGLDFNDAAPLILGVIEDSFGLFGVLSWLVWHDRK